MANFTRDAIASLARQLENDNQSARLLRCIDGERDREKEFFLVNWNADENVVTMLGTQNVNGKRSEYKVKIGDDTVSCNCPDTWNACKKYGLVCKHVCFIVARVAKVFSESFFNEHRLTESERETILKVLNDRAAVALYAAQNAEKSDQSLASAFIPSPEELQDVCPICYDDTTTLDGLVKCPTCRQTMHSTCIKVWLSKSCTCVLCRSDAWKTFRG